jgi:beta-lactamase superfamily II metal-dependent hydrolase
VNRNNHLFHVLITLLVVIGLLLISGTSDDTLTLAVMDVGQGQSIVICTPNGRVIVVDCGSTSGRNGARNAASVVRDYLKSMGKSRIDMVILSHPHDDHINGFAYLLHKVKTSQVLDTGIQTATPDYRQFMRIINATHPKYRIADKGTIAFLDDGVRLTVLHPVRGMNSPDLNESSMVMRIEYGKISFLIASDAGFLAECEMLYEKQPVRSTVLVVGHHGSELASSPEWLRAVNPDVAAISVGKRNSYGHPSKEVLLRLHSLKVKVYRTDSNGAILFSTNGSSLGVKTYRRK